MAKFIKLVYDVGAEGGNWAWSLVLYIGKYKFNNAEQRSFLRSLPEKGPSFSTRIRSLSANQEARVIPGQEILGTIQRSTKWIT